MNLLYFTLSILLACANGTIWWKQPRLVVEKVIPYQWQQLEFSFLNDRIEKQAENNGNLIPEHAIPIDVQPDYHSKRGFRTFVTIPRFQDGIPYTLATVSADMGDKGPLLKPYPNYEAHNSKGGTNCGAIISAFRVAITECNQMWVIDSGCSGADGKCPPKLLLYDLNTDQLIHHYSFPKSVYTPGASLFITPVADVRDPPPRGSCRRTMIYVADVNYHGLVVYNYMQNKAWRVENRFMYPDPGHGLLSLAGERFMLMDGMFGLATDKQNLYFHPLASDEEFAVPLRVLDNSSHFEESVENMHEHFRRLGKRSSACAASAMDSKKNLYCVTLNPIELIAWNVDTPYNMMYFKKLLITPAELQFVSGMKVVRNRLGYEELWMLSNKYQNIATGKQNFNEVNFRIVVVNLSFSTASHVHSHNMRAFRDNNY